jgi:1,4-alpha-glucan branching enzyme
MSERTDVNHGQQRDPLLTDVDLHLFNEGTHTDLARRLGAHVTASGTRFSVWAPNAERVDVLGDVNGWTGGSAALEPVGSSGIWSGIVDGFPVGSPYKYRIHARQRGYVVDKADPFAFQAEVPPRTASVVCDPSRHAWNDGQWMARRGAANSLAAPISIYEVHLGSWGRGRDPATGAAHYRALGSDLADHCQANGFTHVELLPITEHPFYGSWGYQTTGYFAPTSRYGDPLDFKAMIDTLHQRGIGVILDWVPSHFPADEHGLGYFDGTHLFEHADPRVGHHPDWDSLIFNYGRHEVRSFLLSSAHWWLDEYHVDGLRVDAVASMLYLDYSRRDGEWIPNVYGGRENLEAIAFMRQLNETVYARFPDVQTYAEESTAWPMVSRPTYVGGLGFGLKWDMGWMHDTLAYLSRDPVHRSFHHHQLTFRAMYQHAENYTLPLSHDEVVHGKGSLYGKMPGDDWQKRANLRLLYGYQWTQPGKKLLFMGGEVAQYAEWDHDGNVEWWRLDDPGAEGVRRWVEDLNRTYRERPALHALDVEPRGFEWVDASDSVNSTLAYLRRGRHADDVVLVVANLTPVSRHNHRVGVPSGGRWIELLNSDAALYGGGGQGNLGGVDATPVAFHGRPWSLNVVLPPLGLLVLAPEGPPGR